MFSLLNYPQRRREDVKRREGMQLAVFFNGSMDLASAHLLASKPKFLAMALPSQCWGATPKDKYDTPFVYKYKMF
jgi:hypothetical protein